MTSRREQWRQRADLGVENSADALLGRAWSARLGQALGLIWLVYLIAPLIGAVQDVAKAPLSGIAEVIAGGLFLVLYVLLTLVELPGPGDWRTKGWRRLAVAYAVFTLLAVEMNLVYGPAWQPLFVFAGTYAGRRLPFRYSPAAISLVTVLCAVVVWLTTRDASQASQLALITIGIGFLMVFLGRMYVTIRDLREAREEIVRLAVDEERLRFARDLHDLLGHSLSLITLKSELAGKLLTVAPEKAAAEIGDVEKVARVALREVREAVGGYRQPSLALELRGARVLLDAAGIEVRVDPAPPSLPAAMDATLAWTVREGATNVIRHGQARRCTIQIVETTDHVGVEVLDDGQGCQDIRDGGSGLAGLRERASALGGCVEAGPREEGRGFRLAVTLDLNAHGRAERDAASAAGEHHALAVPLEVNI